MLSCQVPELCPQAWAHHTHMPVHTEAFTNTRTHRGIRTEVCMTMSRRATFAPALPLTLRGCLRSRVSVGRVWGSSQGLFTLKPLPYNLIKYQDLISPSKPTPAYLLQEAFLPHVQLPRS